MKKRLTRSKENKKIFGVCGGIAKYFDMDPTIIRLLWIIAGLVFGGGIIAYFLAALIMPQEKPEEKIDVVDIDEKI